MINLGTSPRSGSAASTNEKGNKMNRITRAVSTAVLALGIASAGAAVANAATNVVSVGGDKWTYGVSSGTTFSNYYHGSKVHGSTACSSVRCAESPWTPKGRESRASTWATLGGNTAYWRVS